MDLALTAQQIDQEVDQCKHNIGANFIMMGQLLKQVRDEGLAEVLVGEGSPNAFYEYLASKRIPRTTGLTWIRIFETFVVQLQVPQERLIDTGWASLERVESLVTPENYDEWLNKAEALSLSDLKTEVKEEQIKERQAKLLTDGQPSEETKGPWPVFNGTVMEGLNDLDDEKVDLILTHPVVQDQQAPIDFHSDWLAAAYRVLKPHGMLMLFTTFPEMYALGYAVEQNGFSLVRDIVWTHPSKPTQGLLKCHNTVIWAKKGSNYICNAAEPTKDVWDIAGQPEQDHPTDKPIELISRLIELASDPKQTVLDPFCGAGSVLYMAKKLSRRPLGVEVEEAWVNFTARRLK